MFIGRWAEDTGIKETTECLAKAANVAGVPVHLVLVGCGQLVHDLKALAGGSLNITRHPPTTEIGPFYAAANYVIGTGYLGILDAFRAGRPVIVPALSEIKRRYFESFPAIREHTFYFTSGEELLNFLTNLLVKPDILATKERIRRASAFVRNLSWERVAGEHIAAYLHAMA
ncbi:MAG: hypothetical protein QHI48_01375 [Bacteroidota bacterium]|nr:hypothetical protein [Bacteroidota bacterium]